MYVVQFTDSNSDMDLYLADTVNVNETQSLTNVSGVVPVMSSHSAGVDPPIKQVTTSTNVTSVIAMTTNFTVTMTTLRDMQATTSTAMSCLAL